MIPDTARSELNNNHGIAVCLGLGSLHEFFFLVTVFERQAPRILSALALMGWHCGLGGVGPAQTKWGREKAGPTDHCGGHMAHPMPSQTPRSPSQVRAAPSALVPGRPSHQRGWLCVCVCLPACLWPGVQQAARVHSDGLGRVSLRLRLIFFFTLGLQVCDTHRG